MRRLTGSKIGLGLHCLHWLEHQSSDTAGKAAHIGSYLHKCAELGAPASLDEFGLTDADVPMEKQAAIIAYANELGGLREVAYALDPVSKTARQLGCSLERGYANLSEPSELCGTADVVKFVGTVAHVYDYKTGREAEHADDSAQMLFLACCINLAHRVDSVVGHIVHVQDSGRIFETEHEYTVAELRGAVRRYAGITKRIAAGATAPQPGHHCQQLYCPHRGACEEHMNKGKELVKVEAATITSERKASAVLEQYTAAKALLQTVEAELKRWARDNGGIKAGEKVWKPTEQRRQSIKLTADGINAVSGMLAGSMDEALPRSTSKTQLVKVLGKEVAALAMTALSNAGCVTESVFERFSYVKPKP